MSDGCNFVLRCSRSVWGALVTESLKNAGVGVDKQ